MTTSVEGCAYCGSMENITDDHVPPQNLFPKPRPATGLIKVPACRRCNSSASKDDEYFRLKLCMGAHVLDNPSAKANRETAFRSLTRPEAPGLKKAFLSDVRTLQLRSQAGLHVGLAFEVDPQRIHRVVERTVRGLFYHETGLRLLLKNYKVTIYSNDTLKENSPDALENLNRTVLKPLSQIQPTIIEGEVFMYRYLQTEKDPFFSAWALTFFRNVSFLAITEIL